MAHPKRARTFGLKLTRSGAVYIGVTLLLGFAAVNTGNNLLYLLVSALLGFMAVSGLLGKRNIDRIEVAARLPEEIFAGHPTLLSVELRNRRGRFPAFLLEVRSGAAGSRCNLLPPGTTRLLPLEVRFPRRGRQPVPELELRSGFPVSFFYRSFRFRLDTSALVYPAPRPVRRPAGGPWSPRAGEQAGARAGQDGELLGIGDYHAGVPLKSIHWKLSARQGELKVKQQASLVSPPLIVDPETLEGPLEERLGQAAQLVIRALQEQRPTGLRLARRQIPARCGRDQRRRLLEELALYATP